MMGKYEDFRNKYIGSFIDNCKPPINGCFVRLEGRFIFEGMSYSM